MFRLIWWDWSGMTLEGYSDSVGYSNAYLWGEMFIGNGWWLHGCGRYAAIHIEGVLNTLRLKRNGCHFENNIFRRIFLTALIFFNPPASTKLKAGYTCFTLSICLSVYLWTESCLLCIFHITSPVHFIFTHVINQVQNDPVNWCIYASWCHKVLTNTNIHVYIHYAHKCPWQKYVFVVIFSRNTIAFHSDHHKKTTGYLTHWGLVMPYGSGKLGQHWLR